MEPAHNLRVIVSLCKGGSTALIHSLAHAPGVTCYLQTVKSGQRSHGEPDYGIYFQRHEGVALSKETIGHSTVADCSLRVFPSDEAIRATAPIFLFRDPIDTRAAWANAGWGSLELFNLAYGHALELYERARQLTPRTAAIRYERFGEDAEAAFRWLCTELGIVFTREMLHWRFGFPGESPVIWREDVQRDFDRGQSDSARAASGFAYRKCRYRLPDDEAEVIERLVRARYAALPG